MPNRFPLLVVAAGAWLSAAAGCVSTHTANTVTMPVEGMACPNCAKHIAEELREVPGVRSAAVDFDRRTARVVLDPDRPASREALESAVSKWRKEHFAAKEDPECLDPKRREELQRQAK